MENPTRDRRRLLIVEDDAELRTVLERLSRRYCRGVEVEWASDLRMARTRLREGRFDAVLADYLLGPVERGTSIRADCRRHHPEVPIAIMSSKPVPELMARIRDESVRLLPKPFTTREFAVFVESLLEPLEYIDAPGHHSSGTRVGRITDSKNSERV